MRIAWSGLPLLAVACGARSGLVEGAADRDAGPADGLATPPPPDAPATPPDARMDALPDTPGDAPSDAPGDAPSDAPGDVSADAPGDALSDTLPDAPGDAPSDTLPDAPGDAPSDAADAGPCATRATPTDAVTVEAISSARVACAAPVITPPCGSPCGNGVIDACESCDGDAGSTTCQSLGYASGSVPTCVECRYARAACNDCTTGASTLVCQKILGFGVAGFDVAVKPDRIAVASYVSAPDSFGGSAELSFLAPDLTPAGGTADCFPTTQLLGIALAPVPNGWLVALDGTAGIDLFSVGPDGEPQTARRLDGAHDPRFAPRAGAGPLLGFELAGVEWAGLLDGDGNLLWTTRLFDVFPGDPYDAVSIGDAFLLAARMWSSPGGVTVARLELDGRLTCESDVGSSNTEYPELAWDGTNARLTWAEFPPPGSLSNWLAAGDPSAALGPPAQLESGYYDPVPVLANSAGTTLLEGSYTGGVYYAQQLRLVRIPAGGGTAITEQFVDNPGTVSGYRLVALDDQHAVAAWLRHESVFGVGDGVGLALVLR